jgi:hypothetical protein
MQGAPAHERPAATEEEPQSETRRPGSRRGGKRPAPQRREPAPVANIEDARQAKAPRRANVEPRRPKPLLADDDGSHLPAFLLRPFKVKA